MFNKFIKKSSKFFAVVLAITLTFTPLSYGNHINSFSGFQTAISDGTVTTIDLTNDIPTEQESVSGTLGKQKSNDLTISGKPEEGNNNYIVDGKEIVSGMEVGTSQKTTITDITFQKFYKQNGEGGLILNDKGDIVITNATFEDNVITGGASGSGQPQGVGGVIGHNSGDDGTVGSLEITNSLFSGNNAFAAGAIFSTGVLDITSSIFENNSADYFGALLIMGSADDTTTLTRTNFMGNIGTNSNTENFKNAGAIYMGEEVDVTITENQFQNNISAGNGGAINSESMMDSKPDFKKSKLDITDSYFLGNKAGYNADGDVVDSNAKGGAINNYYYGSNEKPSKIGEGNQLTEAGYVYVKDTGFSENIAANAGAIYNSGKVDGNSEGRMWIEGSSLEKSSFEYNEATNGNGGAIYNEGTMVIENTNFEGNTASGVFGGQSSTGLGGAIYNDTNKSGEDYVRANISIQNSEFKNNQALAAGAIFSNGGLQIYDSNFEGNQAQRFGAIASVGNSKDETIFDGVTFKNNISNGTDASLAEVPSAGAIYFGEEPNAQIIDSYFEGNLSVGDGGAINSAPMGGEPKFSDGKLDITGTAFVENKAGYDFTTETVVKEDSKGGAINNYFYNSSNKAGYVYVGNSTDASTSFTNNQAGKGGAIYNNAKVDGNSEAKMWIEDVTFTNNQALSNGGAIYNEGTMVIIDSVFSGNTANSSPNDIYNIDTLRILGNTSMNGGITTSKNAADEYDAGITTIGDGTIETVLTLGKDAVLEQKTLNVLANAELSAYIGKITTKEIITNNGLITINGDGSSTLSFQGTGKVKYTGKIDYDDDVEIDSNVEQQEVAIEEGKTVSIGATGTLETNSISGGSDSGIAVAEGGKLVLNVNENTSFEVGSLTGDGVFEINASEANKTLDLSSSDEISVSTITATGDKHLVLSGGQIDSVIINNTTGESLELTNTTINNDIYNYPGNPDPAFGGEPVIDINEGVTINGKITNSSGTINVWDDFTVRNVITSTKTQESDRQYNVLNIGDDTHTGVKVKSNSTIEYQTINIVNGSLTLEPDAGIGLGVIEYSALNIEENGSLNTNAASINFTPITNAGLITFTGGTNTNAITGEGSLKIAAGESEEVKNVAAITQNTLTVESGTFEHNNSIITSTNIAVNTDAKFTAHSQVELEDYVTVTNNGLVEIDPGFESENIEEENIKNKGVFEGTGELVISNVGFMNKNKISQDKITVNSGAIFTSTLTANEEQMLTANVIANAGTVNLYDGTNNSEITGVTAGSAAGPKYGKVEIRGNVVNEAQITQDNLAIIENASFKTGVSSITVNNGSIQNAGTLTLTGGAIQPAVNDTEINGFAAPTTQEASETKYGKTVFDEGSYIENVADIKQATVTVKGSLINDATIYAKEQIEIDGGGVLTTSADSLKGLDETAPTVPETKIVNAGLLTFTDGTNNNEISGSGLLMIDSSGNVVENTKGVSVEQDYGIEIEEGGIFKAYADDIKATVTNRGTYDVTGGTISFSIGNDSVNISTVNIVNNEVKLNAAISNSQIVLSTSVIVDNEKYLGNDGTNDLTIDSGATINMLNNSTGTVTLNDLKPLTQTAVTELILLIDADLVEGQADNFYINSSMDNVSFDTYIDTLNVINELADGQESTLQISNRNIGLIWDDNSKLIVSEADEYDVSVLNDNTGSFLKISKGLLDLPKTIAQGLPTYIVKKAEDVVEAWIIDSEGVRNFLVENLEITGNGNVIKSTTTAPLDGINVSTKSLTINNLASFEGFANALKVGKIEDDKGTLSVSSVTFTNNSGVAVIQNEGNVILSSVTFRGNAPDTRDIINNGNLTITSDENENMETNFETGIVGTGTTTVTYGAKAKFGENAIIQQEKLNVNTDSSLEATLNDDNQTSNININKITNNGAITLNVANGTYFNLNIDPESTGSLEFNFTGAGTDDVIVYSNVDIAQSTITVGENIILSNYNEGTEAKTITTSNLIGGGSLINNGKLNLLLSSADGFQLASLTGVGTSSITVTDDAQDVTELNISGKTIQQGTMEFYGNKTLRINGAGENATALPTIIGNIFNYMKGDSLHLTNANHEGDLKNTVDSVVYLEDNYSVSGQIINNAGTIYITSDNFEVKNGITSENQMISDNVLNIGTADKAGVVKSSTTIEYQTITVSSGSLTMNNEGNNGSIKNSSIMVTENGSLSVNPEKMTEISNPVTNDGTIEYYGGAAASSVNTSTITSSSADKKGKLQINGNIANQEGVGISNQNIQVANTSTFTATVTDIVNSEATNNGTLIFKGGTETSSAVNTSTITSSLENDKGTLQIDGNIANQDGTGISGQNINVLNASTFTANANDITDSSMVNDGIHNITGGTVNYNVSGTTGKIYISSTNVTGSVTIADGTLISGNEVHVSTGINFANENAIDNTSDLVIEEGAIINTQNDNARQITPNSISITGNANWKLDVSLQDIAADELTKITSCDDNLKITIDDISLLTDFAEDQNAAEMAIATFIGEFAYNVFDIDSSLIDYYETEKTYTVKTSTALNNAGDTVTYLTIKKGIEGGLPKAIYKKFNNYSFSDNEELTNWWLDDPNNNTLGADLIIDGQNKNLSVADGTVLQGIKTSTYSLTINDLANISNFNGAVIISSEGANVTISNTKFSDNFATNGGAVSSDFTTINDETTFLSVTGSTFTNNTASSTGGAIQSRGQLTVNTSSFTNNTSGLYSGAIHASGNATIENSYFGNNSAAQGGGAITVGGLSETTITGSEFEGNKSTLDSVQGAGGAIFASGKLTVDDTKFTGNEALTATGGAIFVQGGDTANTTKVTNSTFTANRAKYAAAIGTNGAGTYPNTLIIENSLFDSNESYLQGAVGIFGNGQLTNNMFVNNKSTATVTETEKEGAGAVYLGAKSNVVITSNTFESNQSSTDAGAIGTRFEIPGGVTDNSDASLDIVDSTFKDNKALDGNGGAIDNHFYNSNNKAGYVYVGNTNFEGNQAANGGAIYNHGEQDEAGNSAAMFIENSTFTANSASQYGGAIFNASTMTINNSKFENNTDSTGKNDIYNTGKLEFLDGTTTMTGGIIGTGTTNIGDIANNNTATLELGGEAKLEQDAIIIDQNSALTVNAANIRVTSISNPNLYNSGSLVLYSTSTETIDFANTIYDFVTTGTTTIKTTVIDPDTNIGANINMGTNILQQYGLLIEKDSSLTINASNLIISGEAINDGLIKFVGGTETTPSVNTSTITSSSADTKGSIQINGALDNQQGTSISRQDITILETSTVTASASDIKDNSTIANEGLLKFIGAEDTVNTSTITTATGNGTLVIVSSEVANSANITQKNIIIETNSELENNGATVVATSSMTVKENAVLENAGTVEAEYLINDGGIENGDADEEESGTITVTNTLINSNNVTNSSGIINAQTLINNANANIYNEQYGVINSTNVTNYGAIVSSGIIAVEETLGNEEDASIENKEGASIQAGVLNSSGTIISSGSITVDGTLTNSATGLIENKEDATIEAGDLINSGIINSSGTITVSNTLDNSGIITSSGTIESAHITNENGGIINNNDGGTITVTTEEEPIRNKGLITSNADGMKAKVWNDGDGTEFNGVYNITGGTVTFDISGTSINVSTVNIQGDVVVDAASYIGDSNVNLKAGNTLKLELESNLRSSVLNIGEDATLDISNGEVKDVDIEGIYAENGITWNFKFDVNLKLGTTDKLTNTHFDEAPTSTMTITSINVLEDADKATTTPLTIADSFAWTDITNTVFATTNIIYAIEQDLSISTATVLKITADTYGGFPNAVYDGLGLYFVGSEEDHTENVHKWIDDGKGIHDELIADMSLNGRYADSVLVSSPDAGTLTGIKTGSFTLRINDHEDAQGLTIAGFETAINVNAADGRLEANNVVFSSNTGTAVITNEGTTVLNGVTFDNTNEATYDVLNNGDLLLEKSSSTFNKGIVGAGTTTIKGVGIDMGDATLAQEMVEISHVAGSSLTVKVDKLSYLRDGDTEKTVTKLIMDNGELYLVGTNADGESSLLETNINGIGATTISGGAVTVDEDTTITQTTVNVVAGSSLTANANNIDTFAANGEINNEGSIIFVGGTNNNTITGDQGKIFIEMNKEVINSTGTQISQQFIEVKEGGKFVMNADDVETATTGDLKGIQNNGELEITGGTNKNIIGRGDAISGKVTISGNVTNAEGTSVEQSSITVNSGASFKANASDLTADEIANEGDLEFIGGTNNNAITGTQGTLIISGDVINNATAEQKTVKIETGAVFSSTASALTTTDGITVAENATLKFNSGLEDDTNNNSISGLGKLEVKDNTFVTMTTDETKTITLKDMSIENGSKLVINANQLQIVNPVGNEGILEYTGGENNNKIEGDGEWVISGAVTNSTGTKVSQSIIKISSVTGSLTTDATDLTASTAIYNDAELTFTGGTNNNDILGYDTKGNVTISGDVKNTEGKTIEQSTITVNSGASFTASANDLKKADNGIKNSGDLILVGSSDMTNENDITGEGNLTVKSNMTSSTTITQTNIDIVNGTFTQNAGNDGEMTKITAANISVSTSATFVIHSSGVVVSDKITNDGTVRINVLDTNGEAAEVESQNNIIGKGDLIISSTNYKSGGNVSQKTLTIEDVDSSFETDITKFEAYNGITDNGNLIYTGTGISSSTITGTGELTIGTADTNADVVNKEGNEISLSTITVNEGSKFKANASNITTTVGMINDAEVTFTGGVNTSTITMTNDNGKMIVEGTYFENTAAINQSTINVTNNMFNNVRGSSITAAAFNADTIFVTDAYDLTISTITLGTTDSMLKLTDDEMQGTDIELDSVIDGSGSLVKEGSAIVTLNGKNTYTGTTTITDGALRISTSTNISDRDGAIIYMDGGKLIAAGDMELNSDVVGTFGTDGANTVNIEVEDVFVTTLTANSTIYGSSDVVKTGSGTLDLRMASNKYTGDTKIQEGTVVGTTANINGTVIGAGDGTAVEFYDEDEGEEVTLNKVDNIGLFKKTGSAIMNVTNDFTAIAANISSGTFVINNDTEMGGSGSTFEVTNDMTVENALLKGYGKISVGSLIIENGATLAPGNSTTTFKLEGTGDLEIRDGGTYDVEFSQLSMDQDNGDIQTNDKVLAAGDATISENSNIILSNTKGKYYVPQTFELIEAASVNDFEYKDGDESVDDTNEDRKIITKGNVTFIDYDAGDLRDGYDTRISTTVYVEGNKLMLKAERKASEYGTTTEFERSHNEQEAATAIDTISSGNGGDITNPLDAMEKYYYYDSTHDIPALKAALNDIAGVIHANSTMLTFTNAKIEHVYDKVKERANCILPCQKMHDKIWAQYYYNTYQVDKNDNSPKFDTSVNGFLVGFDMISAKQWTMGITAGYGTSELKQRDDKTTMNDINLGFYGGFENEKWLLKGMLLGGYEQYSTDRVIDFMDRVANSEHNGYSAALDLEAGYKISLNKDSQARHKMYLKPYLGVTGSYINNEGYEEKGADSLNLKIEGYDNFAAQARAGIGINGKVKKFGWYAKAGVRQFLTEDYNEIESSLLDYTDQTQMKIRSAELDKFSYGGGLGVDFELSKAWTVFANGLASFADKSNNYYGNIGLMYKFGCPNNEKKTDEDVEKITAMLNDKMTEEEALKRQLADRDKELANKEKELNDAKNREKELQNRIQKYEANIVSEQQAQKMKQNTVKTYRLGEKPTFVFGTDKLNKNGKESLKQVATELEGYPDAEVLVEGHTDNVGGDEINQKISEQRASAVATTLKKDYGVKNNIAVIGKGKTEPIASNDTAAGRAKNRRVEVIITTNE